MLKNIFNYSVWAFEYKSYLKDYCDFIRKHNKGRIVSNEGGYQSDDLNLNEPVLQPLISNILNETGKYLKNFETDIVNFDIGNMWININGYKDYNGEHVHSNCLFSGVYYVQSPKLCGDIEFVRPDHYLIGATWKDKDIKNYNSYNSHIWAFESKVNTGLIFPSYFQHRVKPNFNKTEERYSFSFNIIKKG